MVDPLFNFNLESVAQELFERFEEDQNLDRSDSIDRYVLHHSEQQIMAGVQLKENEIKNLAEHVRDIVLPAYDTFCQERTEILNSRGFHRYAKHLLRVAGVVGGLVLLVARFRVNPAEIETILGGSLLGSGASYAIAYQYDNIRIGHAKERFGRKMKRAQGEFSQSQDFVVYQGSKLGIVNDDLVTRLCEPYADAATFFDEYQRVRSADPTSAADFSRLNTPLLGEFVVPHYTSELSKEQRQQRFGELFILAEEYFLRTDAAYAQKRMDRE